MLPDPRYLGQLGTLRERAAVARWMYSHAEEIPRFLGLPNGWWCGLFLQRADLFGDRCDGDVDFIAGPLRYTFSDDEWEARVWAELRKRPFNTAVPYYHLIAAHAQAGQDGCVDWPPRIDYVVAGEVKASHHDGRTWKATHENERVRIGGQLRYLDQRGVNRAAFLHVGATAPPESPDGSWDAASQHLAVARASFPDAFDAEALPGFGCIRAIMAGVPGHNEARAGVHSPLIEWAPARLLNPVVERVWHSTLHERLASLPRPNYLRTWILACPSCAHWQLAALPDPSGMHCGSCGGSMLPS
jgi:hypothetical protein